MKSKKSLICYLLLLYASPGRARPRRVLANGSVLSPGVKLDLRLVPLDQGRDESLVRDRHGPAFHHILVRAEHDAASVRMDDGVPDAVRRDRLAPGQDDRRVIDEALGLVV